MDDYIGLDIPRRKYQIHNIANAIMIGIHYMFPTDKDDKEDSITFKKILKK